MTPTTKVNGQTVRMLLANSGLRQKELCAALGVSTFSMSRWCRKGMNKIEPDNAKRLADYFKVDLQTLQDAAPAPTRISANNPAEDDLLQAYRSLTPLQQARIRVAIEELRSPNA